MKKINIIETGRLDNETMNNICGGESKPYKNCSDSGPICPQVSGANFNVVYNCAHNLLSCDDRFLFCSKKYSYCEDDGLSVLIPAL